jgi:ribonuclease VapC
VALMVIDTSAVIACLLDEPERASFVECIEADPVRLMSMVGFVETSLVIFSRRGGEGLADLAACLDRAEIDRVAVDARQADEAVQAFCRFGRGRHPAALNIGDCFAYALARTTGEPLLFKGDDFTRTEIAAAAGT